MWPNELMEYKQPYKPSLEERLNSLNHEICNASRKGDYELAERLAHKCKGLKEEQAKYEYHHKILNLRLTKAQCDEIEILLNKEAKTGNYGNIMNALQSAK